MSEAALKKSNDEPSANRRSLAAPEVKSAPEPPQIVGSSGGCGRGTVRGPSATRRYSRLTTWATMLAAALLLLSLKLPLWHMRLEAPQYRDQEALRIAVHPNSLRGDLKELSVLDQYIGVHVPPTLPQFRWLPIVLAGGALLGMAAGLLRARVRPYALTLVGCALAGALALAAVQAVCQMHAIGHHRDQKTVLAGVKDFTPPFLGTTRIAQFTVSSRFGLGAWLIGGALLLQFAAARASRRPGEGLSRGQQAATTGGDRVSSYPSNSNEPATGTVALQAIKS